MACRNPHSIPKTDGRTVLVVEDEILIRMMIADALRSAGLQVIEARTADDALQHLRSGSAVQFVFTDIEMPGTMDGIELARLLRREFPYLKLLMTSGSMLAEAATAIAPFIGKPYNVDAIVARVCSDLASPANDCEAEPSDVA